MAYIIRVTFRFVLLIFVLCIVTIVTGQVSEDRSCPHFGVNFRGRCFWFVDIITTWNDARHLCHRLYGDHVTLVTIKDEETNTFLRQQWTREFWIGLHEAEGEGIWRWLDNTVPKNGNYQNWLYGTAPSNILGNCAVMKGGSRRWQDFQCRHTTYSVCAELPSAPMCPHGGIFFRDRCYWRGSTQLSWKAANQACQNDFGPETRLAVARDAETDIFLSRLANANFWLGISDIRREGVWEWIDGAPVEYQNWAYGEPNNQGGKEDCGMIWYPRGTWNDCPCGDSELGSEPKAMSYICAIPPCFVTNENLEDELVTVGSQEIRITENSVCTQRECTQRCVKGGACNSTGQCICVKQFPEMTCYLDRWEVETETEIVNTTTGSSFTLKCKFNLPVDHISSLQWYKCEPGFLPPYRHTITNFYHQGYSTLQVSDVSIGDAGKYYCKVNLVFSDMAVPVVRKAFVNVTEGPTPVPTTNPTSKPPTTGEGPTTVPTTNPTTKRPTTEEGPTTVPTTNPTTKRPTTEETSVPLATTKTIAQNTSSEGRHTTGSSERKMITEMNTRKAAEKLSVSSSLATASDSAKHEDRKKKEVNTNKNEENKHAISDASKYSTSKSAGGNTVLIVILFVITILSLGTVFLLMIKMKKMERASSENGRLLELQENL